MVPHIIKQKEKRKRQAAIEDKRRQLEDKKIQLQHLKSKSLREKWLMQGAPTGSEEEEVARQKQCEDDEQTLKILEDNVQRLERDIGQLEGEELLISAKEQSLREKLKETELSFKDLQKRSISDCSVCFHPNIVLCHLNLDAVNYVYSQIPDRQTSNFKQKIETCEETRVATIYAMEINVEKDRNTGETKIVSTSALDPEGVHQRGVKVYDDGNKVVYEVHHGGSVVENGIHKLSARDVDDLIQKSQSTLIGEHENFLPDRTITIEGNPSHVKEQIHFKEAKLELVHKPNKGGLAKHGQQTRNIGNADTEAALEQPVTMIFMGYQNIDDEDETKKVLGYDDTIKAELVLIDEDDEKSLREKTVTDVSTMDGNAAELVSGKLLTETTEPSSPEGKEESLATDPIAGTEKKTRCKCCVKPQFPEDGFNLKKNRDQNCTNFLDSTNTEASCETMEIDVKGSHHKGGTLEELEGLPDNLSVFLSVETNQNGLKYRHESLDSDVAKEIQYLDDVLEANCCDSSTDNPFNGAPSESCTILDDHISPCVGITASSLPSDIEIKTAEHNPNPFSEMKEAIEVTGPIKINGHSQKEIKDEHNDGYTYPVSPTSSNSSRRSSKDGEILPKIIKKEAKFELRAFHEEKKPSKLFDDFSEKEHFRVRKVRPSEEVQELEKERLDLIRSQAMKKNPSIAAKWWNPPQEKTLEEQLDSEQLESHMKYKERKERQHKGVLSTSVKNNILPSALSESAIVKKEDIVTEQIDFSSARKQFLNMENESLSNYKAPPKRSVSANLFTVKPFYKSSDVSKSQSCIPATNSLFTSAETVQEKLVKTPLVKAEKVDCISEDQALVNQRLISEASVEPLINVDRQGEEISKTSEGEFISAKANLTLLKDEDSEESDRFVKSVTVSFLPEEQDSGLDDLSVKSQDTTLMETLSNDFSIDNISDSGASNETMSALHDSSLGDLSQPQTPVIDVLNEYALDRNYKSDQGFYSPSLMLHDFDDQLEYHAGLLVQSVIQQALAEKAGVKDCTKDENLTESKCFIDVEPLPDLKVVLNCSSASASPGKEHSEVFQPPKVSSPVQETRVVSMPKVFENKEDAHKKEHEQVIIPSEQTEDIKYESYFSKYSQAAELRSTASMLATQETEIAIGPFKLRSKKQRTLSMIEEEIRAAQEREQELKKERERQSLQNHQSPNSKHIPALPTRTVSYKTAPGKIEKVRTPTSPKGEFFPIQPDLLLEEAACSQRPKNLMETLMDDYETHKNKRREKTDDSSVLEAVRVNRRKSALALKWEAGLYANREEDE
ncbi:hypothetical protein GDO86_001197 [Hymenochirus boettgeri]|uniref:A-kinase anchor protein 2 n=1 Tax=Hymenochirus boettgeri TaxID=247094 RepID=A0A8T2KH87_9PIPI|nr:hypothetical protein GDO86_001197 [Hymenochirus boettgeri]